MSPSRYLRSSHIPNQRFGSGLNDDDFNSPIVLNDHRTVATQNYYRPWVSTRRDDGSTLALLDDKVQVTLDVHDFSPNEVEVTSSPEGVIKVHALHGERQDLHGFITREFTRKYQLPRAVDVDKVVSSISSDGVLTIVAPTLAAVPEEWTVPIQMAQSGRSLIWNLLEASSSSI